MRSAVALQPLPSGLVHLFYQLISIFHGLLKVLKLDCVNVLVYGGKIP